MRDHSISRTDAAILGMLTVGPMSGYDMKRFCEQALAHFWHESYGNLYPRLRRLADAGLVRSRREPRDRAPDAIVYSITPAGEERFAEWMREDPGPDQVRSEFVLKVFFGARSGPEACAERIRAHRHEQEARLDAHAATAAMVRDELSDRPESIYWLLALRRGQLLTEARLRWCDESLAMIENLMSKEEG